MDYEERIKYRDNEFLYEKCCKQYSVLMEYQHKMSDYKQQIETLKEENDSLRTRIKTVKRRRKHESAKKRELGRKVEELASAYRDLSIENECLAHDNNKYYMRIKELEEENKKLKEQLLNYQMPPHNQKCYKPMPIEFTCTAKEME